MNWLENWREGILIFSWISFSFTLLFKLDGITDRLDKLISAIKDQDDQVAKFEIKHNYRDAILEIKNIYREIKRLNDWYERR